MKTVRSIFVSELHLGCRYANAAALLNFLKSHQPEYLYLVGDIIDGWRVQRVWYWTDSYSFLIRSILDLLKRGTIVRYTPGNHDEFLRDFIDSLGSVQIADEFIHTTADNRQLLVMRGDQFDAIDRAWPMLKPGGVFGVVDFYVSRKHAESSYRAHGRFTRTFWPAWLAADNVFLSSDHVRYLQHRFDTVYFSERVTRLPYIPLSRVPYYLFVGRKPLLDPRSDESGVRAMKQTG